MAFDRQFIMRAVGLSIKRLTNYDTKEIKLFAAGGVLGTVKLRFLFDLVLCNSFRASNPKCFHVFCTIYAHNQLNCMLADSRRIDELLSWLIYSKFNYFTQHFTPFTPAKCKWIVMKFYYSRRLAVFDSAQALTFFMCGGLRLCQVVLLKLHNSSSTQNDLQIACCNGEWEPSRNVFFCKSFIDFNGSPLHI